MKPRKNNRILAALLSFSTLLISQASAVNYYWDVNGATAGVGVTTPSGAWVTDGSTWSTSANGTVATSAITTAAADDLFFSAGTDATGAYTVTLNDSQSAKSLSFRSGTATISGAGGIINLGENGLISVGNSPVAAPLSAVIGANTSTLISGTSGLTKSGVGTLTLNGSSANTFTGGLNVNGGTLGLSFANLATTTNLIDSGNSLSLGGGSLTITGKAASTNSQSFNGVTVASGGGQIRSANNSATIINNIDLGSLTATASGGSLLLGAGGTTVTGLTFTTTSNKDATGIYGGRVVFSTGTANTGFEWVTTASTSSPYTLSANTTYVTLATASGTDSNNSRVTANLALAGSRATNSLKFQSPVTAQTLTIGANTLTLANGGLLFTGAAVTQGPRIGTIASSASVGNITAGNGSGSYDLVVHQYNASSAIAIGTIGTALANNTTINSNIVNNGSNAVTLVKSGPGGLVLGGTANTFTGGIIVNEGNLAFNSLNAINNNAMTFNANSIIHTFAASSTNNSITLNNNSQLTILNNNSSFTVTGNVVGSGGISAAQGGQGSVTLNLNGTGNIFTGPIRFMHNNSVQSAFVTVASLADTSTYGDGNITFGANTGTSVGHNFTYSAASGALTLDNRRFELGGAQLAQSINNAGARPLTINSDLLYTGTGAKVLTLGSTSTGLSTFAGILSQGSGTNTLAVAKTGSGSWVLTGANTYTGSTNVSGGTLQISNSGSLGAGNYAGSMAITGNFTYSSSADQVLAGVISGAGTIVKDTANSTLTLSGVNTYSGNITLSAGVLSGTSIDAFGINGITRSITVGAGTTMRFDVGNIFRPFSSENIPTFSVEGTVVNNFANNNALTNVSLTGGTITATAGSATYGAFRFNGTVTSTGDSTISSSEPITGRMMLRDEGSVFNVTGGTLTISAPLAAVERESHLGLLVKNGDGALVLSGPNTYSGGTTLNGGTTTVSGTSSLGSGIAALSVNGNTTILNLGTTLDTSVGSLSGTGTSVINNGGLGKNLTVRQTLAGTFAGSIAGAGGFTLSNLSSNTLTFSGSPAYTGATAVNGGTLRLDYSTNDTSKLSDTAALILGGGAIDISGGTHAEIVASTTLTAGTASRITRSVTGAVIALNDITVGQGATIDFAVDGIATTDTLNTNGILGTWATVGGTSWASNSTNSADGLIVAYSAFTDVARLDGSSQVIADNSVNNVRIIEGTGNAGNITLGAVTTVINSLNQSDVGGTSAAIIDVTGRTLRTNAILLSSGAGALNIGTAANSGTLTTATAGGTLILNNSSSAGFTIDATISDNTSASSLTKLGTGFVVLNGTNTYTGTTTVAGGSLDLVGSITGSAIVVNGSGSLKQNAVGLIAGSSSITFAGSLISTLAGANTHTGGTTLTSGTLELENQDALGTGALTINGGALNTSSAVAAFAGNNAMNWNGSFNLNPSTSLNMGTGAVTLGFNSRVSFNSNTVTVGGAISGAFSLSKSGTGTLALNGANTYSGGTFLTGAGSAGSLILGNASALGTGPLTINSFSDSTIDSSVPNLVNANNNPINLQVNLIFAGTENLDLGTGPVTILGNRTLTVAANTLKLGGISGPFNFTKSGDGSLVLSGVSTYSGTTTINGLGGLTISGSGSLGAGNYTSAITNNGGFVYESSAAQTLSGVISGAGTITKSGAATLTLAGANTYTGATLVNGGTLQAAVNSTSSGLSTSAVTIALGSSVVLDVTNTTATTTTAVANGFSGTGVLGVQFAAAAAGRNTTFAGLTGFAGAIQLSTLGVTGDKWTATSLGLISAPVIVGNGTTIFVNSGTEVSFGGGLTLNGAGNAEGRGALRIAAATVAGDITLNSSSAISMESAATALLTGKITSGVVGTQTLTLGGTGATGGTLSGVIGGGAGTIELATAVAGAYILSGANTYSGSTSVNAGSLILQNATALGSTAAGTSVANGARVELDNVTVTGESITLNGSGGNFLGALQSRSGTSEWTGNVTIDAEGTRIGAATDASMIVSGVIDDGPNDYRILYRVNNPLASVTLTGANTYTGITAIAGTGPVIVASLNSVVGGTTSSHLGAPTTADNGRIIIGTTTVNGVLRYVGAGETTDRTIQIGDNAVTPVATDTGGSIIESEATTTALSFSAPVCNIPTNAATGTTPARTLTLSGSNTNDNTISGVIQNNQIAGNPTAVVNLTKTGVGKWVLAGNNTYTGLTAVADGTLTLSGNRTVAPSSTPGIDVGGVGSPLATLNVQGDVSMAGTQYRVGVNGPGLVNHSAGNTSFTGGNQFTIGVTAAMQGTYHLSGGTASTVAVTDRGVILGVNANCSGAFQVSGTGVLTMASESVMQIGRSESAGSISGTTGSFTQTGTASIATVGQLRMGGANANNANTTSTLTVSAGTFTAASFSHLSRGNTSSSTINISGTADVTLPAFPTERGTDSTATITFDGGTLKPTAASTSYMSGLTNAFILDDGLTINTANGSITISQNLLTDVVSTGGGLTKAGVNTLTLAGNNNYTGATNVTVGTLAFEGGSQASPVTVSAGASLGFVIGAPTTSTSTFNLTTGTVKIIGTPTLASHPLITFSAGITGTPVLDAPVPGYTLKVEGNTLSLVKAGYASWAAINAIGSAGNLDKDGDGVANAVEYVLGGDVNSNDLAKLPTLDTSGTNLVFTFKRDRKSIDGNTAPVIEVGDDLTGWPGIYNVGTTTTNSSIGVTVSQDSPTGFDTITLTVAKGTDPKKFARLKVTVTE